MYYIRLQNETEVLRNQLSYWKVKLRGNRAGGLVLLMGLEVMPHPWDKLCLVSQCI